MERAPGSPSTPPADDDALTASSADLTGKTVGDFQILRRLGEGGMGQVYIARQISLSRKVAFKILKADLATNATSLKRFQAEATAAARASHANIVQVYAIGEHQGLHYMALEYVEGPNLRQYLEKKGPPEVLLALSIMRQVAAALQRAGEMGIIHRDIKPENILLTRKGEVKVADFGLSRCFTGDAPSLNLTQSGVALGTPLYMSPEQVQGQPVDPRSDIYSFGVTCYAMLAGQPPFRGQSAFEVAMQHVQAQPEPLNVIRPDLPAELCALVDRMMAKNPADRYQTAREILQDLGRLREKLSGGTSSADRPPPISLSQFPLPATLGRAPVARRVRRWVPWAAALSVLSAVAVGAAFGWRRAQPPAIEPASEADASSADVAAVEALFSQQQREKVLLKEVAQTANPPDHRDQITRGLDPRLELGVLYLDQWRLADADRFYEELISEPNGVRAYRVLGRLGRAVVLSFKDDAPDSNRMFLEVLGEKKQTAKERLNRDRMLRGLINRNPRFGLKVAEAIDRDAVNTGKPLPAELQDYRKPQPLVAPRHPAGQHQPAKAAALAR